MSLWLSFAIAWLVILVPPAICRAYQREQISKRAAFFTTLALFFVNHVLFTVVTQTVGPRPMLLLGAFAAYGVLRWPTRRRVADDALP